MLAGNDIRVVEADTFSAARFWDERVDRRLLMTSCGLRHLAAAAFSPLPTLRSLGLADNRRLPRDDLVAAVRRVDTLTKLDVSAGSAFRHTFDLAELFRHPHSAAGLRLEKLVTAENGIRTISANLSTAAAIATMRSLDLSSNEMTTLAGGLSLFRRLERLSVKENRLTRIDSGALTGLQRLTSVDLSYNRLEELDGEVLRPLTRLRYLNLAGNRLRTLSADAVPSGIEYLSVRGNRLVSVPFLASLAHLSSVDVSANGLQRLDAHQFSQHIRSSISANFSRRARPEHSHREIAPELSVTVSRTVPRPTSRPMRSWTVTSGLGQLLAQRDFVDRRSGVLRRRIQRPGRGREPAYAFDAVRGAGRRRTAS